MALTNSTKIFLPAPTEPRPKSGPAARIRGSTLQPGGGLEEKVDETGAGYLGARDHSPGVAQLGHQGGGDLAGVHLAGPGQLHGQVAGQVAVLGLLGVFHHELGGRGLGSSSAAQARSRAAVSWAAKVFFMPDPHRRRAGPGPGCSRRI